MNQTKVLSDTTASGLVGQVAFHLVRRGPDVQELDRRGGKVLEFRAPVLLEVDPARYLCLLPSRELNPWTSLAEFPWLIAGRSDIEWLLPYLPQAAAFSDDGKTWRAGYGPRLRHGPWGTDQLAECAAKLRANPNTRQAVLSLWDPSSDGLARMVSKDFPCTNWLHFTGDGTGNLDLLVGMRSNDLIWGYSGVNVVNFSLLLQVMAADAGMEPGVYRHIASNLHVYERHFLRVEKMASDHNPAAFLGKPAPLFERGFSLSRFTNTCYAALDFVTSARKEKTLLSLRDAEMLTTASGSRYLGAWAYFMSLHTMLSQSATMEDWLVWLRPVPYPEWKMAAAQYLNRRYPTLLTRVARDMFTSSSHAEVMNG